MTKEERVEAFIADINEVVRKHGLALVTCSCCGLSVQDQIYDREIESWGKYLGEIDFDDGFYGEIGYSIK